MAELYWWSLMTLLYWEWHLIPRWPLRSIFVLFTEQLLKDFLSSGTPLERSMIDRFLGDAFGALSYQIWSTFLQSSARLPIHTLNYWTVQSVVSGFKLEVSSGVTLLIVDQWQSCVCFIRSGVTLSTLLMVLYQDRICQCGLHPILWSHIGILMHRLAAEHRCTAGLLFLSRCPSGTILLTPYSMAWDWRVLRAGPMLFILAKLLYPYYNLLLFFPFSSFCLLVGIVGLRSSDW